MNSLNTSPTFNNIVQSPFWKDKVNIFNPHNDKSQILIPIMVYFDDFEVLNPLGSHSGQLKIGGVYIKILALPDHLNSKLTSILLAMLFFTEDRKKFGNQVIFNKLVEKLNILQNNGISLNGKIIKLITCVIGGDNLGMNSILGFMESFNSLYYCRFCRCSSNETKYLCNENSTYIRNQENYYLDLSNSPNSTGIKENSIFNNLNNFHVIENNCIDLMHDILEGVCHYDLLIILKSFVLDKQIFTIEDLNKRIDTFDFGPNTPII